MHSWPNVEKQLAAWLTQQLGRPVYTETPTTLGEHLPAYQIARVGGNGTDWVDRAVQVEVDSLAATRGELWDTADRAAGALYALRANGTSDWYVDDVTEVFGPAIEPYENDAIRRATATYSLVIRPHHTTT